MDGLLLSLSVEFGSSTVNNKYFIWFVTNGIFHCLQDSHFYFLKLGTINLYRNFLFWRYFFINYGFKIIFSLLITFFRFKK